jgi:hypothetical protein
VVLDFQVLAKIEQGVECHRISLDGLCFMLARLGAPDKTLFPFAPLARRQASASRIDAGMAAPASVSAPVAKPLALGGTTGFVSDSNG